MRRLSAVLVLLMVGSQLAHAQGPRPYTVSARPAVFGGTPSPGCIGRPYVLIANGASDQMDVKEKLDAALEYSACPMITRTIPWANPNDTTSTNYRNKDAQLMGAAMICAQVQKIHQVNPTSPITLIGYCAGSYVVLLAAEQLPPGSVDRIILLAPSVSSCYDVRLALRASKCGMDNFYTSDDTVLELKESEVGTTDGRRTTTAGRTGFLIARTLPGDPSLAGLRQYNFVTCPYILGGHFATLWQSFIRNNLLPIMPCGPGGCGRGPVCPPPGTFPPPGPVPPPYPPPQGPGPYAAAGAAGDRAWAAAAPAAGRTAGAAASRAADSADGRASRAAARAGPDAGSAAGTEWPGSAAGAADAADAAAESHSRAGPESGGPDAAPAAGADE